MTERITPAEAQKLLDGAAPHKYGNYLHIANLARSLIAAEAELLTVLQREAETHKRRDAKFDALEAELITLRARVAAADRLAEAARYFYEYGENDRAVFSALTAYEATK